MEEEVISKSILAAVSTDVDWISIPDDQRIIGDEILDWIAPEFQEVKQLFEEDPKEINKENLPPTSKRLKTEQYASVDETSATTLESFSKGYVPPNTKANTDWAVRAFLAWAEWCGISSEPVPKDLLASFDAVAINKWLSLFIIEVRKKDGSKYPNSSLNLLLCGLKRYMKSLNPDAPNFLDEQDSRFAGLRGTRDTVSRSLRAEGIGASVKHTAIISQEEVDSLWAQGVLGISNPTALLNAVFYLNG